MTGNLLWLDIVKAEMRTLQCYVMTKQVEAKIIYAKLEQLQEMIDLSGRRPRRRGVRPV
jgi:hypothetical protein